MESEKPFISLSNLNSAN
jgi:hypothetical protein